MFSLWFMKLFNYFVWNFFCFDIVVAIFYRSFCVVVPLSTFLFSFSFLCAMIVIFVHFKIIFTEYCLLCYVYNIRIRDVVFNDLAPPPIIIYLMVWGILFFDRYLLLLSLLIILSVFCCYCRRRQNSITNNTTITSSIDSNNKNLLRSAIYVI